MSSRDVSSCDVSSRGMDLVDFESAETDAETDAETNAEAEAEAELAECCVRAALEAASTLAGTGTGVGAGCTTKGVFTLEEATSQILVVNDAGCSLLGYNLGDMHQMRFSSLFLNDKHWTKASSLHHPDDITDFAGKVVELCSKSGEPVAVSLWIHPLEPLGRKMAVIEPANIRVGTVSLDIFGGITDMDVVASQIFKYNPGESCGQHVSRIIPRLTLPPLGMDAEGEGGRLRKKQHLVGTRMDAASNFPLSLRLNRSSSSPDNTDYYQLTIQLFPRLTGIVVIDASKSILFCTHQFVANVFGYSRCELIGQPVTMIIPNFCKRLGEDSTKLAVRWEKDEHRSLTSPESPSYWYSQSEMRLRERSSCNEPPSVLSLTECPTPEPNSDEETPTESIREDFQTAHTSLEFMSSEMDRDGTDNTAISGLTDLAYISGWDGDVEDGPLFASSELGEEFSLNGDDISETSAEFVSAERTLLPIRQGFFWGAGLHKDQIPIGLKSE